MHPSPDISLTWTNSVGITPLYTLNSGEPECTHNSLISTNVKALYHYTLWTLVCPSPHISLASIWTTGITPFTLWTRMHQNKMWRHYTIIHSELGCARVLTFLLLVYEQQALHHLHSELRWTQVLTTWCRHYASSDAWYCATSGMHWHYTYTSSDHWVLWDL